MTTSDAARDLDVSSEFVRGEIQAGRLHARTIERPGKRKVYRISHDQLEAYKATYWRPVPHGTTNQPSQ